MFSVRDMSKPFEITHFKDFCLSSVTSRSARRLASCESLSLVCYSNVIRISSLKTCDVSYEGTDHDVHLQTHIVDLVLI